MRSMFISIFMLIALMNCHTSAQEPRAPSSIQAQLSVIKDALRQPEVIVVLAATAIPNADSATRDIPWNVQNALSLRPRHVITNVTVNTPVPNLIYVSHDPSRMGTAAAYSPPIVDDDSVRLLFLTPGTLFGQAKDPYCWRRATGKTMDLPNTVSDEVATMELFGRLGLGKQMSPETWRALFGGVAEFYIEQRIIRRSDDDVPPVAEWDEAANAYKVRIRPQRPTVWINGESTEEYLQQYLQRHRPLGMAFVNDLSLILTQMGGQTGAEHFSKITATEKEMKSDIGKALLRELKSTAPAPTTPKRQ